MIIRGLYLDKINANFVLENMDKISAMLKHCINLGFHSRVIDASVLDVVLHHGLISVFEHFGPWR
jgi:hypothetical protein